jgi:allantoin racemase
MRKILYIARTRMSSEEIERRRLVLQSIANEDSQINIEGGTSIPSIESAYEGYLTVPEACRTAMQAVKQGYQAIVLGCFSDPGLDAVRELVEIPVVGPGQTSVHLASMLGERFTVLATGPRRRSLAPGRCPVPSSKFASSRGIGMSVLEVRQNRQKALQLLVEEGRKAIDEDGADVAVLGCLSLAFHKVDEDLRDKLPIPIVNPIKVAVKTAEMLVDLGLSHSKLAFPNPKEIY